MHTHAAGSQAVGNGAQRAERELTVLGRSWTRASDWHRAAAARVSLALAAPPSRREALLWGLVLFALVLSILQWNQRTVIVVPVSENPRAVIT